MSELFGPCSPVPRSPTPSILTSLVLACTPSDSLGSEETYVNTTNPIADELEFRTVLNPKVVAVPLTASLLQTVTPVEDIVLVEDASDDEEAISQVTVEDPIFLITIEDNPMHSMTDVTEEVIINIEDSPLHSMTKVNEEVPRSLQDPSSNATSSIATAVENDLTPSPSAILARRQRKSYDRSSLHRSGRIAQRNVLKDLGVVGKDGKLNESAMQDIVVCLKELLPPDLLKPLMSLKGRAFWDFVAEASLSLR